MATQETCRCAVADCAVHQSATVLLDALKELVESAQHLQAYGDSKVAQQAVSADILYAVGIIAKAEGR